MPCSIIYRTKSLDPPIIFYFNPCALTINVILNTPEKVEGARSGEGQQGAAADIDLGQVLYDLARNYGDIIIDMNPYQFRIKLGTINSEFGGIEFPYYTLQFLYEFVLFPKII